ncbi:MAG TPA: nucleoside transporter C-terminal domain-containing protein [Thermoguttaceae bacterium]|nr:nucleoside transporter C-terminal domain-containing protein [Thermoguttaceae bacterium]
MERLISFFGLLTMIGLAWLISENRRKMNWRLIVSGVVLQFLLAVLLLGTPMRDHVFHAVDHAMTGIIACSDEGARFVYGEFFYSEGFIEEYHAPPFFVSVLSAVIFFSSLTAVLFYLGVLQWLVRIMARVMVWVMDVSGAESLCASANVFVGMTTAPLMIRPYLDSMTRSELMAMMTGGMATVAGGTMVAYVSFGAQPGHLMVASLLSAPASLVIAKIMVPETEDSPTKGTVKVDVPCTDANLLDAACRGAADGLKLVLNIAAMLIAFIALVYFINWALSPLTEINGAPLTLQRILGWVGAPLAWLMGVEWKDAHTVGVLLGEKTVFNEFVAFRNLQGCEDLSARSHTIATYALCGFANFGSIAVMIGGVGGLAPQRRKDFARYGFRSMIGGALAAFMTAAIAGMLI